MNGNKLYYSIGHVAQLLGENQSVIRFWEKEFESINPRRTKGGTRLYTEEDIEELKKIQYLTRIKGYTLTGVKEQINKSSLTSQIEITEKLKEIKNFLLKLKEEL